MQERQQCPLCQKTGLIKYLQSYQINLEEAVVLCENKLCPYPLAETSSTAATFSRSFEEISSGRGNGEEVKIPDSQVALQTKVASHMRKFGHRLQKDAIGIQTGSPQLKKKLKSYSLQDREPYKKRGTTPALHRQTGLNSLPKIHLSQSSSQSFQNFKSFTKQYHMPSVNGETWNSCNGSDGGSDKDSLLDSSIDSLESNSSSSSSNGSIGDGINVGKRAIYPAFRFEQCKTRSSPKSMPNLQLSSSQTLLSSGHLVKNEKDRSNNNSLDVGKVDQVLESKSVNDRVNIKPKSDFNDESFNFPQVKNQTNVQKSTDTEEVKESVLNQVHVRRNFFHANEIDTYSSLEKEDCLLRYPSVFPQWMNRDALCWLDVVLCLAVHNETLKTLVFSESFDRNNLIYKLVKAHNQASHLLQKSQRKCSKHSSSPDSETVSPLNGIENGINQTQLNGASKENIIPTDTKDRCLCSDKACVEDLLDGVREEVWNQLKCRLKCEKGQNESPVFAIPLLLKEDKAVDELFRMNYWFEYKCSNCGIHEKTDHTNTLPTFPAVVEDFMICDPQHRKKCQKCGNTSDVRTMVYKKLPECLLMHFTEGLPDVSWAELQFGFHGYLYTVTGVVQYVKSPDHFITWLRNPNDNKWLKCDDLQPMECRYRTTEPKFPSSQIHVVMWERLQTKPRICRQVAMEIDEHHPSENLVAEKKSFLNCDSLSLTSDKDNLEVKLREGCNDNVLRKSQKGMSSVNCTDSVRSAESPCSTLSTESSDSVMLLNFISSTPASKSVLRPIPKPIFSATALCMSTDLHNGNSLEMQQVIHTAESYVNPSHKSVLKDTESKQNIENSGLLTLNSSTEYKSSEDCPNELVGRNGQCSTSTSQICGPKSLIKPSTVFCVPKKSSEEIDTAINSDDFVAEKEAVSTKNDKTGDNIVHAKSALKNIKCKLNVEPGESDSKNSSVTGKEKNLNRIGPEVENTVKKTKKESEKESSELTDNKTENNESEKTKRQTNSSRLSQSSRFKVPRPSVRKPSVSRDAFFTLQPKDSKADSSACSTPVSISTPGLNGNLTFLNSVKQYLLSRTTGRTEQKFRFEGLNLKSTSNRSSIVGLSELNLGLPVSNNLSSNGSDLPSVSNSACDDLDTQSLSNSSLNSSLSATSARVTKLIERLEQGPIKDSLNSMTLKRKLESTSLKKSKRRSNDVLSESDEMSSRNDMLKENSDYYKRKKLPGGKNMKLVRKLVKNAEKAKIEQGHNNVHLDSCSNDHQNYIANGNETKCDTEMVLQDLYEALNIPFNSVNSTMSDIMTDVDDILNFVSVGDVLPGQHHGDRSLSCSDGTLEGNQKHSDCWIRRPGRNSA